MKGFLAGRLKGESLKSLLLRLHRDERGAEGLEKLLIICAIVLPLLGVLIIFRDRISEWVTEVWSEVKEESPRPEPEFD